MATFIFIIIITFVKVYALLQYFSPQEKLEDKTSIDLIYRQVVKDGLSRSCVRLTNECFKELRDVFSE